MLLGIETTTQDLTGTIINETDCKQDLNAISSALQSFVGEYNQIPPMYSSVKKNGRKLYELAREGKEVERKIKKKHIHAIEILNSNENNVLFDVVCSEGTYIRTLCHDAGKKLGCGAVMSFLLRKESCGLALKDSITLEEFEASEDVSRFLMAPDEALKHLPSVTINLNQTHKAHNGNPIPLKDATIHSNAPESNPEKGNYHRLYLDKSFIGIGLVQAPENRVKFTMKFNSKELKE